MNTAKLKKAVPERICMTCGSRIKSLLALEDIREEPLLYLRRNRLIHEYIKSYLPTWLYRFEDLWSAARYFADRRVSEEALMGCVKCTEEKTCKRDRASIHHVDGTIECLSFPAE